MDMPSNSRGEIYQSMQFFSPMSVVEHAVYRGAHLYSHLPMIRIMLDLGRMEFWPSSKLDGFADRLLEQLPGLAKHVCSRGQAGGLVERLAEGTWMGHVIEHVALELQSVAGCRVTRGKTRSVKGRPGVYNILFAYEDETVGLAAGRTAIELVNALLPPALEGVAGMSSLAELEGEYDFATRQNQLQQMARRGTLGPTTRSLVDEALRRNIPVERLARGSLVRLGQGRYQQHIRASVTGQTSLLAVEAASDKAFTKDILKSHGVPVPSGAVVSDAEAALQQARRLRYPLVCKPLDGNHGRGVTTGIDDDDALRAAVEAARAQSRSGKVVLERHLAGRDHRILVVDGKVVAVAERVPSHVIGDGASTVAELIAEVNRDPRRGDGHEQVTTRIATDATVSAYLARSGKTLHTVPRDGETVTLCATANLSTGGTAIDRTNQIHPDNCEIASRAAQAMGLDVAGIDFVSPDIARPVRETGGGVIEVNAAPGFRMHLEPSEGASRDVARPVIEMLFPRGSRSRVPIFSITGTNGKSTTARMLRQIFRFTGQTVGMTSTQGVYLDDALVVPGDATGPRSARMVLRDPKVEVAILETARGGILREGLGYDRADIGAVLNVTADHLGLRGIDTLGELADLKALVVETVARNGTSVLNADDPMTRAMARRARGRRFWFSLQGGEAQMAPWLRQHIDRGGAAMVREPGPDGGLIVLHDRGLREIVMRVSSIPATLHGVATFNIANALAASAMAVAHGLSLSTIRSALSTFQSNYDQNPGRLNVHDAHGIRTIVDYAHNAAGLVALGHVVEGLRHRHRKTIGVISIAGDRRDEDIIDMGAIAARLFDILIFREDPLTRGRPQGVVMTLLRRGAEMTDSRCTRILTVANEAEANLAGLEFARAGDLLVLTPSEVDACWQQVIGFRPQMAPTANRQRVDAIRARLS